MAKTKPCPQCRELNDPDARTLYRPVAASLLEVVATLFKGGRSLLEKGLLPLVELGGLDTVLVADIGNGRLLNQVFTQNLDFLLGQKPSPVLFHGHFPSKITESKKIPGNVQFQLKHYTLGNRALYINSFEKP